MQQVEGITDSEFFIKVTGVQEVCVLSPPGLCQPVWLLSGCSSSTWRFWVWPPSGWFLSSDFPPCPPPLGWPLRPKHIQMSTTKTPPDVWKRVVKFFTLQIGFDSSRILEITAPQRSSFGVGAQHLHTLQVSCLWWTDHLFTCLYEQKHVNLTMCHWDYKSEILHMHLEN